MRSLFLSLVLIASACGGGASQPSATAPATAAQATQPDAATAPAATSQADAGPSFADLVRGGKLASYKVTYKWTSTAGGQSTTSQQTWYFKPPKTRLDFSDGQSSSLSTFMLDTGTYLCTVQGNDKSCFQTSTDAATDQNVAFDLQEDFQKDPSALNATLKETRTIAGQQAFCYTIRELVATQVGAVTMCYSRTGIPLLMQWGVGADTFSMEATAFSTDVPDSDFVLPATPIKLP